jgi:hypothetical protein
MKNNISKINTIYKSLFSLLVLTTCGLGLLIYFVDPFVNYTALYQFFIALTIFLFLLILFIILHLRLKVFKNLIFLQETYKSGFNALVFACSATFFLLLIYTNSLNLISFGIFCILIGGYCTFEFLD